MNGAVPRGLLYAAGAFGLGFLLGPIRALVVAPRVGAFAATLAERPVTLGFCWWLAGRLARPMPGRGARLGRGAVALAALLLAEFGVGAALRGWGLAVWLRHFATAEGAATGVAYLVFAALRAARRRG